MTADSFNTNALQYHAELQQGLRLSGESACYFAEHRIDSTVRISDKSLSQPVSNVLDYGCGVGSAIPFLVKGFPSARIYGSDIASEAVRVASLTHQHPRLQFVVDMARIQPGSIDLVYCNGVFHHIPANERQDCLAQIGNCLQRGGLFCLWENHPWNPGTQWVMRNIPFDRDAKCLSPIESRRRMRASGFDILTTEYHFFFPRSLRMFRRFERRMRYVPIGAQYVVVGQKR